MVMITTSPSLWITFSSTIEIMMMTAQTDATAQVGVWSRRLSLLSGSLQPWPPPDQQARNKQITQQVQIPIQRPPLSLPSDNKRNTHEINNPQKQSRESFMKGDAHQNLESNSG